MAATAATTAIVAAREEDLKNKSQDCAVVRNEDGYITSVCYRGTTFALGKTYKISNVGVLTETTKSLPGYLTIDSFDDFGSGGQLCQIIGGLCYGTEQCDVFCMVDILHSLLA
jgi:hypothetical protein